MGDDWFVQYDVVGIVCFFSFISGLLSLADIHIRKGAAQSSPMNLPIYTVLFRVGRLLLSWMPKARLYGLYACCRRDAGIAGAVFPLRKAHFLGELLII